MESFHPGYISNPHSQSSQEKPWVKIVEQPASRSLRFRYECEGRHAGSIPGENSTPENRTYPTIQVINYNKEKYDRAMVVVSCVTKDAPYRPHPHNLVGKEPGCKNGICTMQITNPDMTCSFTSLGIQCVKKRDIEESLRQRAERRVDPFRSANLTSSQANNIDLNVVRLCFQVVVLEKKSDPNNPTKTILCWKSLNPVVSNAIYDKKALSDLGIVKLSHYSASVSGGQEVILLCDRVNKDDLQVYFYELKGNEVVWEGLGDFQPTEVHKNVAVWFRTPRYKDENIRQPVVVYIQLRRPSDGAAGEPRQFQLLPRDIDPEGIVRKRQKIEQGCLDRFLRENLVQPVPVASCSSVNIPAQAFMQRPMMRQMPPQPRIKEEIGAACGGGILYQAQQVISNTSQVRMVPVGHSLQQPMDVSAEGECLLPHLAQQGQPFGATPSLMHSDRMSPHMHAQPIKQEQAPQVPSSQLAGIPVTHVTVSLASVPAASAVAPQAAMPPPVPPPPEDSLDEATEKLDSLDLDFDPAQLSLPLSADNLNFDSLAGNFTFPSGFLDNISATDNANAPQGLERQMSTSEQRITRIQKELDELNNLYERPVTDST